MPEYSSTTITPADSVKVPAMNGSSSGNFQLDALRNFILASKGQANGLASLDANGKLTAAQLPDLADDVLVYANYATFPASGTAGKLYIAADTNKIYRWDDSLGTPAYVYLKVDWTDLTDGTVTVKKAECDASGNTITSTYETKADANDLKNALTPVANAVEATIESSRKTKSVTYETNSGFCGTNGTIFAYSDYHYSSKIPVKEGDILSSSSTWRVITAYNGDSAVAAKGKENVQIYTVPSGIDSVVVTWYLNTLQGISQEYTAYAVIGMDDIESDISDIQGDITDIQSDIDNIEDITIETLTHVEDVTFTPLTVGFVSKNGTIFSEYTSYNYTQKIPVNEGDVITATIAGTGKMRVVTAYNGNTAVADKGAEVVLTYTVPNGIDGIIITEEGTSMLSLTKTYTTKGVKGIASVNQRLDALEGVKVAEVYKFDIDSNNTSFVGDESHQDLGNYKIEFKATVDTFNGIIVGHGYNEFMTGYVKVTPTMFEYYLGDEASPRVSEAHNLTIADYISIRLNMSSYSPSANVKITTNGGIYSKDINWDVRYGKLRVYAVGANVLNDCVLSYTCSKWDTPIHLYGDSYFGTYTDRWTYYLQNGGFTNYLLNSYSGRASESALRQLKVVLKHSSPKKIVWCMGMNDPDNGAINSGWLTNVTELISICQTNHIELILATIPNVPSVDNSYKNAYVRASGYRYIDFANAVGASSDTTWYSDMLSNDNVHPAAQGAIALFNQAVADVPELMNN